MKPDGNFVRWFLPQLTIDVGLEFDYYFFSDSTLTLKT